MNVSDETLADLMSNARVIASVGVVSNPLTTGYRVAEYQQSQGYKVIGVNHDKDMILGHPTVHSVTDIGEPVDIVNVLAHPSEIAQVADAAIQSGAKALWLEPGIENKEAEERAMQAGLTVVSNRSFEREHRRLLADKDF
ncbi:CoA-binding protein [Alicyclobacillus dauci]|uniref:CoA-binding protein n=1 Tax=Alicyclobacillus dauci TaxID=1475485 RepID=A0ABY6Z6W7_9BACL|nr:CoA-binding protein [Alicyclobacillus dauci]WAH38268.1 CoA-binding protein [Alicyclobacillus dauci]